MSKPFSSPTFWIHPPEPVASLSSHQFDPPALYRPRIFPWLPHFLCKNSDVQNIGQGYLRRMAPARLAALLTLRIHSMLCPGHTIARKGANPIFVGGIHISCMSASLFTTCISCCPLAKKWSVSPGD